MADIPTRSTGGVMFRSAGGVLRRGGFAHGVLLAPGDHVDMRVGQPIGGVISNPFDPLFMTCNQGIVDSLDIKGVTYFSPDLVVIDYNVGLLDGPDRLVRTGGVTDFVDCLALQDIDSNYPEAGARGISRDNSNNCVFSAIYDNGIDPVTVRFTKIEGYFSTNILDTFDYPATPIGSQPQGVGYYNHVTDGEYAVTGQNDGKAYLRIYEWWTTNLIDTSADMTFINTRAIGGAEASRINGAEGISEIVFTDHLEGTYLVEVNDHMFTGNINQTLGAFSATEATANSRWDGSGGDGGY